MENIKIEYQKTKVKIFNPDNFLYLESQVNEWIEKNSVQIIEIKFHTYINLFVCSIVYKTP